MWANCDETCLSIEARQAMIEVLLDLQVCARVNFPAVDDIVTYTTEFGEAIQLYVTDPMQIFVELASMGL